MDWESPLPKIFHMVNKPDQPKAAKSVVDDFYISLSLWASWLIVTNTDQRKPKWRCQCISSSGSLRSLCGWAMGSLLTLSRKKATACVAELWLTSQLLTLWAGSARLQPPIACLHGLGQNVLSGKNITQCFSSPDINSASVVTAFMSWSRTRLHILVQVL